MRGLTGLDRESPSLFSEMVVSSGRRSLMPVS